MSMPSMLVASLLLERVTLLTKLSVSSGLVKEVSFFKKKGGFTSFTELVRVLNFGVRLRLPFQFVSYTPFFVSVLIVLTRAGFIEGYKFLTFSSTLYREAYKSLKLLKVVFKLSISSGVSAFRGIRALSTRKRLVSVSFLTLLALLRVQRQPRLYIMSTSSLGVCTQTELLLSRSGGVVLCIVY